MISERCLRYKFWPSAIKSVRVFFKSGVQSERCVRLWRGSGEPRKYFFLSGDGWTDSSKQDTINRSDRPVCTEGFVRCGRVCAPQPRVMILREENDKTKAHKTQSKQYLPRAKMKGTHLGANISLQFRLSSLSLSCHELDDSINSTSKCYMKAAVELFEDVPPPIRESTSVLLHRTALFITDIWF